MASCAQGGGLGYSGGYGGGSIGGLGGQGGDATGGTMPTGGAGGSGGDTGGSGGSGGLCAEEPCKLTSPQCGCPEGEACHYESMFRICLAAGDKTSSQYCQNDCAPGMLCLVAPGTEAGPICHEYCHDDGDCDPPGGLCLLSLGGNVGACTHNCDPITTVGCAEPTHKCDIYTEADPPNRNLTQCSGAGTGTQQQPCSASSDCAPGLSCINVDPDGLICLTWCNVATPSCPVGMCYGLNSPLLLGSVEYGVCYQ